MHHEHPLPLVELTRRIDDHAFHGFVVARNNVVVVLHQVSDRFNLDGYSGFRVEDLQSIERAFAKRDLLERALRLKEEVAKVPADVDASSMKALMDSAQRVFGVLWIERELVHPDEAEVGTIRMTSEDTYVLQWLDPNAQWDNDDRPFRYRDVTRLQFGTEYEQTLLAVARSREADG
jgi:hypothetical protein